MALWNRLINHPGFEQCKSLYNDHFPLEVHFVSAFWIEEQIIKDKYIDFYIEPTAEKRAENFICGLIDRLEQDKLKLVQQEQLPIKYRIETAISAFKEKLHSTSLAVYLQIREVILKIEKILNNSEVSATVLDPLSTEINHKLHLLHNQVSEIKDKQNRYNLELENFQTLDYNEQFKMSNVGYSPVNDCNGQHTITTEEYVRRKGLLTQTIEILAGELTQNIGLVINAIAEVQSIVIFNKLAHWQREQALSGNGKKLHFEPLDEIQGWFEKLAQLIWITRSVIDAIRSKNQIFLIASMDSYYIEITKNMEFLIVSGFIVEKSPPQVMKTNTKFQATVRMLTANMGIQLNRPKVTVSIISESQALLQQKNLPRQESSGDILNNGGHLEIQQSTGHLTCTFSNMQLKKIKRSDKKGSESVMDEKFTLLFKSSFLCADLHIQVWSMSLPVVVIVHGIQEQQSWATISWDNAFSEIPRTPFSVVNHVSWSSMADMLNSKFQNAAGRGLTPANLKYLHEKALGHLVKDASHDGLTISWSQFCKNQLPDRAFSFWEWFFGTLKLTCDHLDGLWSESLIHGFISKRDTEEMLKQCPAGTFLLRFSDSDAGGISIAYTEITYDGKIQVTMVKPLTSKHLHIRSLGDCLRDAKQCVTLYPNTPKEKAFGPFFKNPTSNESDIDTGYVPSKIQWVVTDVGSSSRRTSCTSSGGSPDYSESIVLSTDQFKVIDRCFFGDLPIDFEDITDGVDLLSMVGIQ